MLPPLFAAALLSTATLAEPRAVAAPDRPGRAVVTVRRGTRIDLVAGTIDDPGTAVSRRVLPMDGNVSTKGDDRPAGLVEFH